MSIPKPSNTSFSGEKPVVYTKAAGIDNPSGKYTFFTASYPAGCFPCVVLIFTALNLITGIVKLS